MSEKLGDAILELKTDSKRFDKGVDKAKKKTDKLEAKLKKAALAAKSLKVKLIAIGAAIVVGVGITKAIQKVTNLGDEIAKMSLKTGIATETLSSFRLVMNLGGTDIKSFAKGIKTLSKNMFDLSTGVGEEARKAFDAINVSALNTDNTLRDNLDVMFDVADAFSAMEGGARKSAIASALFGRAGLELIPTLNMGSQAIRDQVQLAKDLGLQFSTLEGKQMEAFTDAVEILNTAFFALWQRLVINITPALTKVATLLTKGFVAAKGYAGQLKFLGDIFKMATGNMTQFNAEGKKANNTISGFAVSETFKTGGFGFGLVQEARANQLKEKPGLSADAFQELNDEITLSTETLKNFGTTGVTMFDQMENAVTGWASGFSATMTDILFDSEATFGNIFESFSKMLVQMAIQTQLINPLLNTLFGAFPSAAPAVPESLPFSFKAPGLANGGVVKAVTGGRMVNVAEGGEDELIAPLSKVGGLGGGKMEVNVIGVPEGTQTQRSTDGQGNTRLDIIIDQFTADNVTRVGSKTNRALTKTFSNMETSLIKR